MTANSSPAPRGVLPIVFFTMFLDLAGFSIMFPLFPSMLTYYRDAAANDAVFELVFATATQLSRAANVPDPEWATIVLFGGILGSLYSVLQFLFAPLLGVVSDRIGRRPVLLLSIVGVTLSYVLWVFAGSFSLLVLSRLLGGMMSANLAVASATVADVTTSETRARGMATIGMAFGLGFLCGPALGGLASLVDLSALLPGTTAYGINPFSFPALIALVLSSANLALVVLRFPETWKPGTVSSASRRPITPWAMFRSTGYPGVDRANLAYFVMLLAFSGMEFSLTFVAVERLAFAPGHNALLFVVLGVTSALVQGGYVRRYSDRIGARAMAAHGLVTLIPALLLIAAAGSLQSVSLMFGAIVVLAVGAAQAFPCFTALTSLYTPEYDQGRVMGIFRSLGALGRAIGPLIACLIYWRLGATTVYVLGAIVLSVPVWLTIQLPDTPRAEELAESTA